MDKTLKKLKEKIKSVKYGTIKIKIHNNKVKYINTTIKEKID